MVRHGLIMKKLGMTRMFDARGKHIPVTVLFLDDNVVLSQCLVATQGYSALQIGAGKKKHPSRSLRGQYKNLNIEPKQKVVEFRMSDDVLQMALGTKLGAEHFVLGQYVDVCAVSIGKGFAGGIKRHGFGGLRASHGVSISHRSIGSTGNRTDPGRTFKNKKMPGRMGNKRVTVQNLLVVKVDIDLKLIFVKGAVPGHSGCWVIVKDAVKKSCCFKKAS